MAAPADPKTRRSIKHTVRRRHACYRNQPGAGGQGGGSDEDSAVGRGRKRKGREGTLDGSDVGGWDERHDEVRWLLLAIRYVIAVD